MDYRDYRKKYGSRNSANTAGSRPSRPAGPAAGNGTPENGAGRAVRPAGQPVYRAPGDETPGINTKAHTRVRPAFGTATKKKAGRASDSKNSASGKVVLFAIVAMTVLLIVMSLLLILTNDTIWLPDYVASRVTVEAGRKSVKASDFLTDKSHTAEFADGTEYSLNHVGVYKVKIRIDDKKTCTTRLAVKDTVAPTASPNMITVRVNTSPAASLCVADIYDATDVTVSYRSKPDTSKTGKLPVTLVLKDEGGNTAEIESEITVVENATILTTVKIIECGTPVPDVTAFVGTDGEGEFKGDVTMINTSVPGYYTMTVAAGGEDYEVTLIVRDTKAPAAVVTPQVLYNDGDFPSPARFVSNITDASSVTVTYDVPPVKTASPPYPVKIRLTDMGGNTTVYDSYCTTATDYVPPTVTLLKETLDFTVGDAAIIWRSSVRVADNSGDEVDLVLDTSGVMMTVAGTYTVYYIATDAAGNVTKKPVRLNIHDNTVTDFILNTAVKALTDQIITSNMSVLQQMYAVYNYLSANTVDKMKYANESPHDDWRREAYLSLTSRRSGDCFAFAAVAQAVFRYLGYDTVMVKKIENPVTGNHFWIMVNIGSESSPQWYHFDATPQRGDYRIASYCLTDAQLRAYTRWRNDGLGPNEQYYNFDESLYPKSGTRTLVNLPRIPAKYYD